MWPKYGADPFHGDSQALISGLVVRLRCSPDSRCVSPAGGGEFPLGEVLTRLRPGAYIRPLRRAAASA